MGINCRVVPAQHPSPLMQDADHAKAVTLAFEMRHPGRLLAVVRQVLERGQHDGSRALESLAAAMRVDDVQPCLEYCRSVVLALV